MSASAVVRGAAAPSLIEQMIAQESAAAATFESRWTMRALKRVDADLCQAIDEQRQLFQEAILTGEDDQIREHGEAMCRGWIAAVLRMERAQEPDDAYLLGQSGGTMVAIAQQRSAQERVRDLHGDRVVFLTPDEIADMFVGLQGIAKVKSLWPDAEIVGVRPKVIDLYHDEAAKEDY